MVSGAPDIKAIIVNYFKQLKENPEKRLRLVLAVIFTAFFFIFVNFQLLKTAISYGNPKWTVEFPQAWSGAFWEYRFPKFALCGGFEKEAEPGSKPVIGTISNLTCAYYSRDSSGNPKATPVSTTAKEFTLDVGDFQTQKVACFAINDVESQQPLVNQDTVQNYIQCTCNSSTYVKFAPYSETPNIPWNQWTNIADDTASRISLEHIEIGFADARPSSTYWQVRDINQEYFFKQSGNDKLTLFSINFPQSVTTRYQQFFSEDLGQMIGIIGGVGALLKLFHDAMIYCAISLFGVKKGDYDKDMLANDYEENEEEDYDENQRLNPTI